MMLPVQARVSTQDIDGRGEPTGKTAEKKYVFAHFMVGNTYPYKFEDWVEDIKLASAHGIDGFALNVGREEWQSDRCRDCFRAALQQNLSFNLFFSFDMSSFASQTKQDVEALREFLKTFASFPNLFRYREKVLVSTFAGETSLFGFSSLAEAWKYVKSSLDEIVSTVLVPAFFVDPSIYPSLPFLDGSFNWNGGWPTHLTPSSSPEEIHCPRLLSDFEHLRYLGGRIFMTAVSPWFFTHYGPDSWNKNWIYRGDDWLYVRRWEQFFALRDQIDIVQIISWNDYGESHYVGPIKGAQPNSHAWVDGFPHECWLHLTSYYARAFKENVFPTIASDRIFLWARPHLKAALALDSVPRPDNWELADDKFWVVVFSVAPARVRLASGSDSIDVEIGGGIAKLSHKLAEGGGVAVCMIRNGIIVAQCQPEYHCQPHPAVYSFNVLVAMSS